MPLTMLRSPDAAARWLSSWVTGTLRTDSRRVQPGDAFIAWPGYATDGRRFVRAALDAGATTCLVEAEGIEAFGFEDARVAALPRLKAATGAIAHAYFGEPVYTYSLKQGIDDGFLAPFKVIRIDLDKDGFKGQVKQMPAREDVTLPIREQLIIELYSK